MNEGAPKPAREEKPKVEWRHVIREDERPKGWFRKHLIIGAAALAAAGTGVKAGVETVLGGKDDGLLTTLVSAPTPPAAEETPQIAEGERGEPSSGGQQ